jgi:Ca2+-binding RTX toxin-like protein
VVSNRRITTSQNQGFSKPPEVNQIGNLTNFRRSNDMAISIGIDGNNILTGLEGNLNPTIATSTGTRLMGTDGNDRLTVPGGNSNLRGYTILGIGGSDVMIGGGGRDRIVAASGSSFMDGGDGNDQVYGSFGKDTVIGGNGDDILFGDFGDDYLDGGSGNDRLFAGFGDDLVFGGDGNDTMDGGVGGEVLFGGAGNDVITGGTNGDPKNGEDFFRDFLVGGSGSDNLDGFGGGIGNTERDVLIGGGAVAADGSITSTLGDGARDTFVLANSSGVYYASGGGNDYAVILDFEAGIDRLRLKQLGGTLVNYTLDPIGDLTGDGRGDTGLYAQFSNGSEDLIAVFNEAVSFASFAKGDITLV